MNAEFELLELPRNILRLNPNQVQNMQRFVQDFADSARQFEHSLKNGVFSNQLAVRVIESQYHNAIALARIYPLFFGGFKPNSAVFVNTFQEKTDNTLRVQSSYGPDLSSENFSDILFASDLNPLGSEAHPVRQLFAEHQMRKVGKVGMTIYFPASC